MAPATKNKLRNFRRRTLGADGAGGTAALERLHELTATLPADSSQWEAAGARGRMMRQALGTIRSEFEPSTWQAFWRTTIDEQKSADVADELGLSCAAVRQAKYCVLRRLRGEIAMYLLDRFAAPSQDGWARTGRSQPRGRGAAR